MPCEWIDPDTLLLDVCERNCSTWVSIGQEGGNSYQENLCKEGCKSFARSESRSIDQCSDQCVDYAVRPPQVFTNGCVQQANPGSQRECYGAVSACLTGCGFYAGAGNYVQLN